MGVIKNFIVRAGADFSDLDKKMKASQKKVENFGKKMQNIGGGLTKGLTVPITGAVAGITALRASTAEYRSDMSKFEQNVKSSGTSLGKMKDELFQLTAVTGEGDAAIEALSNLMATGFDDTEMEQALNALTGAVIKFPDTLKIEGLADGLQETLATGKAVGTFAELIERMGGNVEEFDAKMAEATTTAEKQNVALEWLAKSGLSEVAAEYENTNKAALDASKAQQQMQDKMADLAKAFDPLVTALLPVLQDHLIPAATEFTEWVGKMAEKFSKLEPETQKALLAFVGVNAALGPMVSLFGGATVKLAPFITKMVLGKTAATGLTTASAGLATANTTLGVSFLGLAGPILGVVAALGLFALGVKNAVPYAKQLRDEGTLAGQALAAGGKGRNNYNTPRVYNTTSSADALAAKMASKSEKLASYAIGTNYVPSDGLAYLHKGEAVIPADQNKGFNPGGVVVNIYGNITSEREADITANRIIRQLKLAGVKV